MKFKSKYQKSSPRTTRTMRDISLYQRIYAVVRQIPPGKVATYGQIARIVGNCNARMVGYALASLQSGSDVPWQRVINSQGKIPEHGDGIGSAMQRQLLQEEGVRFDRNGSVELNKVGWPGPDFN